MIECNTFSSIRKKRKEPNLSQQESQIFNLKKKKINTEYRRIHRVNRFKNSLRR